MEFNEKLKELRIKSKLTQEELAEQLHISRQSISKWEQGINEPNIEMLKKLSDIFGVTLNELLETEDKIEMTKKEKSMVVESKLFLGNVALAAFTVLLSFVLIRMMPYTVPMHYDLAGRITRYGSKWETLIFLVITLIVLGSSALIHFSYSKKKFMKDTDIGFIPTQIILLVAQVVFAGIYIGMALKGTPEVEKIIIPTLAGIFTAAFIILSIFSAPFFNQKRNAVFGFRTNFTLSNDEGWYKVNRFQSYSGLLFSSIAFIITIITFEDWNLYLIGLILISVIPTLIYHEVLRKKLRNK